ncbi:MAG: prepilin-type N-terminal cleavage/methylation domain-containing protein [Myxococcales bacterium]|nr:prepilin-type N-terminal cleavage/methylation domain-containing protein [Myxococcales bacterium]
MTVRKPARFICRNRARSGFTLVELTIVVAMIAVLAAITIPSVKKYAYRSKRSEAILNLRAIFAAQHIYAGANGEYGDTFEEIGFSILGGVLLDSQTIKAPIYTYSVQALSQDGVPRANFQAVATGDIDPTDAMLDILMIENDLTIVE